MVSTSDINSYQGISPYPEVEYGNSFQKQNNIKLSDIFATIANATSIVKKYNVNFARQVFQDVLSVDKELGDI